MLPGTADGSRRPGRARALDPAGTEADSLCSGQPQYLADGHHVDDFETRNLSPTGLALDGGLARARRRNRQLHAAFGA